MPKKIDLQQQNVKHLLKLVQENPDLEIMPMVNAEIVPCDDWNYWAGSWGEAVIDEYWINDERIYFKSQDEDELLDNEVDNIYDCYKDSVSNKELEAIAKKNIDNYDWRKAIVVKIELP